LLDKLSGPRGNICEEPKYAESLHLPHNLRGYFDYEQGMACAKKLNKPVFIDFTGFGCVNCREMEARVWSDDRVLKLLSEEFVIIALYVDDKWISLPEEEHYISKNTGRKITTLSRKNSDIQACLFGSNAQPNYVLLDHEETLLNHEMQHDLKVENFIAFLKTGVRNYQKKHASRKASPSNTSPSH
jgi:thiol:disulfide interchange protein DsbD